MYGLFSSHTDSLAQVSQVFPSVDGCEYPGMFYLGNVMPSQKGQGCSIFMFKQTHSAYFRLLLFFSSEFQWHLQITPFNLVRTPLLPWLLCYFYQGGHLYLWVWRIAVTLQLHWSRRRLSAWALTFSWYSGYFVLSGHKTNPWLCSPCNWGSVLDFTHQLPPASHAGY